VEIAAINAVDYRVKLCKPGHIQLWYIYKCIQTIGDVQHVVFTKEIHPARN